MLDLTDWEEKKYQTRDGRPVRLLCVDAIGGWPVVGLLYDSYDGSQAPHVWRADGSYSSDVWRADGSYSSDAHKYDLINAKTKKEWLMAIYDPVDGDRNTYLAGPYESMKTLEFCLKGCSIKKIHKIEWEE